MARVGISLEAFGNGALPPVCARTGEPADCLLAVRATYTPGWTWLLLPFGGWWAFLIGRAFTTLETTGLVPFSQAALARRRARARRRLAAAVAAALLLLVVLYRLAWPLALLGGCALIALLWGLGWIWLTVAGPDQIGASFDPETEVVRLRGVDDRFRQAVEQRRQPDPDVRYWQTQ